MGKIFKFSAHWLLNDTLNHIILTLHYPEDPEDVSMEMWGWLGRRGRGRQGRGPSYNKHMSNTHWAICQAISISPKKYIYFNIIYIPLQVLRMCGPINYNKRGAPISLVINMYCQHAHRLHFFMCMANLAYRCYTLNFRCNGPAGAGDVRPLNEPQKTTKFETRRSPDVLHHVPGLVSGPRLRV